MNDKQRAAMQMALETLKNLKWAATERDAKNRIRQFDQFVDEASEAITALREALAQPQESLLDSDGENKAVRCFLMLYGSKGLTVGKMRQHMTRCGYPLWPDVVADTHEDAHLTKAEAQTWIRHLLALEQPQEPSPAFQIAQLHDVITNLKDDIEFFEWKAAQPQGEWVDLTDDELKDVVMKTNGFCVSSMEIKDIRVAIAAFKSKNTPPVIPQGDPVAWMFQHEDTGRITCVEAQQVEWGFEKSNPRLQKIAPLFTTPPSVEAAIEATKEKAAKVCEEHESLVIEEDGSAWPCDQFHCAAAIRSMK